MAIDLEAIRRKVNQLNGIKNTSTTKIWKPKPGEHRIRVLPWKDAKDGEPFKERYVYYGIGKSWIVSPRCFGEEDPINNMISSLFSSGKEEDKTLAKKLLPRLSVCAAIIDRGAEDEGPQLWKMNKLVAKDVLALFLSEAGDFTDLGPEGRDLVVTISVSPKKFNGRAVNDVKVLPSMKPSLASADKTKSDKWMDTLPNIDEYFRKRPVEEIKAQFESWLASGGPQGLLSDSDGTEVGAGQNTDAVDDLASELSTAKPEPKVAKKEKKSSVKKEGKEFNDMESALDDALNDITDLA